MHFDVVDFRTKRDVLQFQAVANFDVGVGARNDFHSNRQTIGAEDIALFAIGIADERNAARAIRIVFDRNDATRNTNLVTTEVDQTIALFVTTTVMTTRDATHVIAATRFRQFHHETAFRRLRSHIFSAQDRHETTTSRCRFETLKRHFSPSKSLIAHLG